MVYEYLLDLHPTTLEYIPALATHWQISDDNLEFRFRLNPNARFSDGEPITAEDVVASWRFQMDPGLQAPSNPLVYGKLEEPVAESPYIVRVRAKDLNWRNFLYFSASMPILPAHVLEEVDGATYLRDYNYKLLPGSGPYEILEENIDRGNSIMITRRNEYWGEGLRHNVGLFNFDEVQMVVVRDENLTFEMFKRGDIDFYSVSRAQRWVEEMDFDAVRRGLVQKRKLPTGNLRSAVGLTARSTIDRAPCAWPAGPRVVCAHLPVPRAALCSRTLRCSAAPQSRQCAS
jgi:microcin C transport system substrate-binding protein